VPSAAHLRTRWTHESVLALTSDPNPVAVISARARAVVLEAIDQGWVGPPFDPLLLAALLGIEVEANSEVRDARTLATSKGRFRIEFNPNRPRGRMRYSVAHEVAHTLFPDCAARVRNRLAHRELQGDDWQLEALCNVAAAEFLMPLNSLAPRVEDSLSIHTVLELQRQFDVSTEALLIRLAETSDLPLAAFCASPLRGARSPGYQLDYLIPSLAWREPMLRGVRLPVGSAVEQCTAIGYSVSSTETWWPKCGAAQVEAVGIPPYPGSVAPRVVGLLRLVDRAEIHPPSITYVYGNATEPRGDGQRIVVHIVNDKTATWGGGGFASAVRAAWPDVQADVRDWAATHRGALTLGAVRMSTVSPTLLVASIVAQHGYGPSTRPRIRYAALREGLAAVAERARLASATVHMPRIGTGQAGGSWSIIADLIRDTLGAANVPVTVYDQPGQQKPGEHQSALPLIFGAARSLS
jgi:O-acetyl-ADP-ribose deacetylase (regulator of RNase III)